MPLLHTVAEFPKSPEKFQEICAAGGQQAKCCTLPVVSYGFLPELTPNGDDEDDTDSFTLPARTSSHLQHSRWRDCLNDGIEQLQQHLELKILLEGTYAHAREGCNGKEMGTFLTMGGITYTLLFTTIITYHHISFVSLSSYNKCILRLFVFNFASVPFCYVSASWCDLKLGHNT